MNPRLRYLLFAWLLLIALLGIEFGASFLALDPTVRPLVLIPAALMVAVVSVAFMEIGRGPETIRLCAAAGLLWLCILLGLGSLDPMTRVNHYVQAANLN
jgi:cytochrome c oxidase subunit 4